MSDAAPASTPAPTPSASSPSESATASNPAPEDAPSDPRRPLGNLALSLSGGGYRAAAYHLGSMQLMDRVGLLPGVVGLSTVSGGTICGMAWVVSLIEGKPFNEFYDEFSSYLLGNNVIAEALEGLTSERGHASHPWASLIGAASDVYARPNLFGDRRFGDVLGAKGLQLEEAIFNSTEFHTGLDFRFRRSDRPRTLLGNRNYPLPRAVAQHVRLADIVAASSCFPGGFEPLVFPQQFHWPAQYPLDAALEELGPGFAAGLPLMDGGIYDNQGVESLLLAFDDSTATTLVISDVSARNTEMYTTPANPTRRGWLTLNGVFWTGRLLFVLALAAALVLAGHGWRTAREGAWVAEDYLLYLVPGLLAAGVAGGLWWVHRRLREVNELLKESVEVEAWASLKKLTAPEFTQMLVLRVKSLLALTSSIFMARVRRLVFGRVFEDRDFEGRRVSNLIYSMARNQPALFENHPWLRPGPELVTLAQTAERMPTTLWFTDPSQFTTQSLAGQATCCFVLLRHLVEDRKGQYEAPDAPLHGLYTRLRAEWDAFNGAAAVAEAAPATAPAGPSGPSIWGAR
ncbi:MAG: patatin-like phospholipase family protein [Gemmatimonadetes bacterium]|nr:patatin-like phospholipase family protein [Gemmatimonadota bacterium]